MDFEGIKKILPIKRAPLWKKDGFKSQEEKDQFEYFLARLGNGYIDEIIEQDYLSKFSQKISSKEVQKAAVFGISELLKKNNIFDAKKIKNIFNISENSFTEIIFNYMKKKLLNSDIYTLNTFINELSVEINDFEKIFERIFLEWGSDFSKLIEILLSIKGIDEEFFNSLVNKKDMNKLVFAIFIEATNNGDMYIAKKVISNFNIDNDILNHYEEIKNALISGINVNLKKGDYESYKYFRRNLVGFCEEKINWSQFKQDAYSGIIESLKNANWINVNNIENDFDFSKKELENNEIENASIEGMIVSLKEYDIDSFFNIYNKFSISRKKMENNVFQDEIHRFIESIISVDGIEVYRLAELRKKIPIKGEAYRELQRTIKKIFIKELQNLENNEWATTRNIKMLSGNFLNVFDSYEKTAITVFGQSINMSLFNEVRELKDGIIGKKLEEFGIKNTGFEGLKQLKEKINELRSKIAEYNPEDKIDFYSDIQRKFFMNYIGYNDSEYGQTTDSSLIRLVENLRELEEGDLRLFKNKFKLTETYKINKKESSSNIDRDIYREDFLEKWKNILNELVWAKENVKNNESFKGQIRILSEKIDEVKTNIENELKIKVESLKNNPKALIGLKNRISLLGKIKLESIRNFQDNFEILSNFRELKPMLKKTIFSMGYLKYKNQLAEDISGYSKVEPTIDEINWVLNFTQHLTGQETFSKFFTKKTALKNFNKINDLKVFREQVKLLDKDRSIVGQTDLTFSIHRDLHTEVSGQAGDACWASEYNSILRSYENFYSILMVNNKNKKKERVVGSSMLIETKIENGDDLLIIRGLNPKENFINQMDVESYFNAVVDYVKKSAKGKKVAISIDDHNAGHTTNRQILFDYIEKLKKEENKIKLLNPHEAKFNGYDISNEIYLLD